MSTMNSCGECGVCCTLLAIEELGKPAGPACEHLQGGCAIYDDRPSSCRGFHCLWLKSERLTPEARMGPDWRPDRAGFVMYSERGGMRLNVVVDPAHPQAWKREPYYSFIKRMADRVAEGLELLVHVGDLVTVVFPTEEVDLGPVQPEHTLVSGYAEREGRQVPYAMLLSDPPQTIESRSGAGAEKGRSVPVKTLAEVRTNRSAVALVIR